jgi:hypothetical protein
MGKHEFYCGSSPLKGLCLFDLYFTEIDIPDGLIVNDKMPHRGPLLLKEHTATNSTRQLAHLINDLVKKDLSLSVFFLINKP